MNGQHPLAGIVAQVCLDAATAVEALGDAPALREAAELTRSEVRNLRAGAAVAVVAGETKRGKSSVINALLGDRDLLPVEADVATATYIEVRHGEPVSARVHHLPPAAVREIKVDEVAMYAAVDPDTGQARRDDVDRVEIHHPASLLDGLCLIDTPGVGGLDAGHRAITLAGLSRADALVFVVSGARELTSSELDFLAAATERITGVLFVLAQADKFPGWPEVLERNRALLAGHGPRWTDAPWYVVSSRDELDAADAARAGDTATAGRLHERGGFGALTAALTDGVAAHAQDLRIGNALQVAAGALAAALTAGRRRLRALTDDPLVTAEIQQLRAQLAALEEQDAAWRTGLRRRSKKLSEELTLGFRRSLGELRTRVEDRIAGADPNVVDNLPAELGDGLHGIWLDLRDEAERGFADIATEIAGHFPDLETSGRVTPDMPDRLRELPGVTRTTHDQTGLMAFVERIGPASRGGALAYMFLAVVTGGTGIIPLIGGTAVAGEVLRRRFQREKLTRARGDANRYVGRIITQAQTEIPAHIKAMVDDTVGALTGRVTAWIADERQVLAADLAENRQTHQRTAADLAARRERLSTAVSTAEALLARTRELRTAVGSPVTGIAES
ncbi:dynamin family protein [Actinoplanes sp. HUAS TT8]|uniref:dynamin family protein n=1 Tax=Actinoplanes sp. HUAS TT8 TaxID=3447453 RepID=UPI003F526D3C